MSNREKILQYKQTQLQKLNKNIEMIQNIKPNTLYRFTFRGLTSQCDWTDDNTCIATLNLFNREGIRLNILASDNAYPIRKTYNKKSGKNPSPDYVQSLSFTYIQKYEELPNQDLALCLGYDIKTQYLERFFK